MMRSTPTFFIVKTMTNKFFVGLDKVRFNHLTTTESGWLVVDESIHIPPNNVDFTYRHLEYPEFKALAEEYGIQHQDDYKETILNYYKSLGVDMKFLRLIAYFNDLY